MTLKIRFFSNLKQISSLKNQDNLLSTQPSWIRALDSKFKIYSKKLTNFRICYNALKLLNPAQLG
jgi:hypothetical protein